MDDLVTREVPPAPPDDELPPLARYAEQAYLDYAISVVKGRALPDVCDGQKPVQRRILFAMHQMSLGASAKPVKSARVVGDVLGKFHPHSDQAAYDALVRMAQPFSLRYPLIDGQGNFGSRDGDGAAAMRYTEARLTRVAELLLSEIDEGTVDFIDNYDGSMIEPKLLPARLPMVLMNGASGIAVGLATEIPPHNLGEVTAATVMLMRNPKVSDAELFEVLPGPDFPGGAQLISATDDIHDAYRTGRGSLKLRAASLFEELARGQWQWVVTELPPGVSSQRVLEEIEDLTNPKVKAGKKTLSVEQQQLKTQLLGMLDAVRDESGKEAAVRLVFEPKTSKIDRDLFVRTLLAHTSLESNTSINLVMVGIDGRPRQKSVREILLEWIRHRQDTVTRRTRYRLQKVQDRIHILEGRHIVMLNVDEVIHTIRNADEPKAALIERFSLSERQADDILEMRLRQLARLEGIRIEKELAALRGDRDDFTRLLDDPALMKRRIIKELETDAKTYGDARRTRIEPAERAVVEIQIPDEPVTLLVSSNGWLRSRQGHGLDLSSVTFKAGDALYAAFECRSIDQLLALGSNGRVYSVAASSLPSGRGDGVPVTALIDLEAATRIVHFMAGPAQTLWLLSTPSGYGFTARLGDMQSRVKGGKQFLQLDENQIPLQPAPLPEGTSTLALLTEKAQLLVFEVSELKSLPSGGRGTQLIDLASGDELLQAVPVGAGGLRVEGTFRGKAREESLSLTQLKPYRGKRARKGKTLDRPIKAPLRIAPI